MIELGLCSTNVHSVTETLAAGATGVQGGPPKCMWISGWFVFRGSGFVVVLHVCVELGSAGWKRVRYAELVTKLTSAL